MYRERLLKDNFKDDRNICSDSLLEHQKLPLVKYVDTIVLIIDRKAP
jgi:hypothetical protein